MIEETEKQPVLKIPAVIFLGNDNLKGLPVNPKAVNTTKKETKQREQRLSITVA